MTSAQRPSPWQPLALLLLFSVAVAAAVVASYALLTQPYPGHNDFLSRWEGARSYWQDGLNPYGDAASLNIQVAIYGRPVVAGEDPGYFAYPFYTALLLYPLVQVEYAWASAIWMVLLGLCLLGALALLLDIFRWRPAPLLLGVLVLWVLLGYFSARGLILGQPGLLVYFLQVLALWGLARRRDGIAGAALALSTLKPQMGYLIVPFLLLWALRARRWHFIIAFGFIFGGLMGASFLLLPGWLADWLNQLALYPSYTALGSPVWIAVHMLIPGIDPATGALLGDAALASLLELLLTGVLYAALAWAWWGVLLRHRPERLWWTVALTLVITHLAAPRTATPHYVVFALPVLFLLRELVTAQRRRGIITALVLVALLLVGQWAHFMLTVTGKFEHPSVYLPLPFGLLLLLWLTRRRWWQDERSLPLEAA